MRKRRKVVGEGDGKSEGVERMGKKGGAGVWDMGGRVLLVAGSGRCESESRESGRKESAGQWKLPSRKGLKLWDGRCCDREGKAEGENGDGTGCVRAVRSGQRRSEHDKSGSGGQGFLWKKWWS